MIIKAVIRETDLRTDDKCNIKLRLTHKRKSAFLSTTHYIYPEHFDNTRGQVRDTHPNAKSLNISLKVLILEAEKKLLTVDSVNKYDVQYLKKVIAQEAVDTDVFAVFDQMISDKDRSGSIRSSGNYALAQRKLKKFYPHATLSFHSVDYKFLTDFNTWMKENGGGVNYISILFRCLRAVFNYAINQGIIGYDTYPFRRFKIKQEKTKKRNLPPAVINKMRKIELSGLTAFGRDMFMLSFYLQGMNMPDLYNLKKTDVLSDRIRYKRKKTKQPLSVKVYPEAMEIIERYRSDAKSKMLLRLSAEYTDLYNLTKRVNTELKNVAGAIGLIEPITFYYARHSWATIGISIGIPRDVISIGLSHSSGSVTETYTQYDPQLIDDANRRIIDAVIKNEKV
jgi:integrase